MLKLRLLAGAVMIAALSGILWTDLYVLHDSILFHLFFLVGSWLCFMEFWNLSRATGHQTFSIWGTFSGCALVVVHYWAMRQATYGTVHSLQLANNVTNGALAVAILGAFLLTARRQQFEASLGALAVTCLGLLYVYFLPSFVLTLRHLGPDGRIGGPVENWNLFGHKMVVATIVLAKGCDVWAFAIGKILGKHKAFPILSPGKTIEGLAAGLIGSMLTALFLWWEPIGVLSVFKSPLKPCILGICIGFAGIMGDLSESLLKRSAGAKDAGGVVPGYGGVMDVADSLMVAGPVAYFLIQAML